MADDTVLDSFNRKQPTYVAARIQLRRNVQFSFSTRNLSPLRALATRSTDQSHECDDCNPQLVSMFGSEPIPQQEAIARR